MGLKEAGEATTIRLIGPPMAPPVELLRWLMQVHCVAHDFEPRAAGLHGTLQRKLGLPIELPVLLMPEGPVGGLRPSLAALDGLLGKSGGSLYSMPGDREWAEALIAGLFPGAVQMFYWHMLPKRSAIVPPSVAGVPTGDRLAVTLGFPFWRMLLRRGLKLEDFDPVAAEARILEGFERVAADLGGKPWLSGKRACFRDLLFAVLASPVILPPGHPASLPPMDTLPPAFRAMVERMRAHPAGRHALKVYSVRGQADCPPADPVRPAG